MKKGPFSTCIFSLLLLLAACSPETKMSVLQFFFDGVEDPGNDSLDVAEKSQVSDTVFTDSVIAFYENFRSYHEPYKKKECSLCHDQNAVGDIIIGEPELCYSCHPDFNKEFQSLHGPVDAGFCSSCHHPHMSKYESLLLAPDNELCFPCHIKEEVERPKAHKDIGAQICIECHDPHGKNDPHFKRKPIPLER